MAPAQLLLLLCFGLTATGTADLDAVAACVKGCKMDDFTCPASCLDKLPPGREGPVSWSPTAARMVCHGEDELRIVWNPPIRQPPPLLYVLQATDQQGLPKASNVTRESEAILKNLTPGSKYSVSVRALWADGGVGGTDVDCATLPGNHNLEKVQKLNYTMQPHAEGYVDVIISWVLGEDATCYYDIWHMPPEEGKLHRVNEPLFLAGEQALGDWKRAVLSHVIPGTRFGARYVVDVVPRTRSESRSGPSSKIRFTVPACQTFFPDNQTDACPPPPAFDLQAELSQRAPGIFDVHATWSAGPWLPPPQYRAGITHSNASWGPAVWEPPQPGTQTAAVIRGVRLSYGSRLVVESLSHRGTTVEKKSLRPELEEWEEDHADQIKKSCNGATLRNKSHRQ